MECPEFCNYFSNDVASRNDALSDRSTFTPLRLHYFEIEKNQKVGRGRGREGGLCLTTYTESTKNGYYKLIWIN